MLDRVYRVVAGRGVVAPRDVPPADRDGLHRDRNRSRCDDRQRTIDRCRVPVVPRSSSDRQHGGDDCGNPPEQEERRHDGEQQHVLNHVRSEVAGRPAVERRTEREREHRQPCESGRDALDGQRADPGDRDAAPVRERRRVDEREHDDGRDRAHVSLRGGSARRSCPRPG